MDLIKFLEEKPKYVSILISIISIVIISYVDFYSPSLFLLIFYLFPICLVTWVVGISAGVFTSALSSILWLIDYSRSNKIALDDRVSIYWDTFLFFGFFLCTALLLSKLQRTLKKLEKLARVDSLTGLSNRMFFMEIAERELNRAYRYQQPLTLAYIDVDDFKLVNDTWGHTAGDNLLRLVADVISSNIRKIDIISRLGGDEFVILLPHTKYEEAEIVLIRIQDILLRSMQEQGYPVTFSIGAITFVNPPKSVQEMLDKADDLMYDAKKSGKNMLKHS